MKRFAKWALMCCAIVICSLVMVSCGETVTGDFMYDVTVSESTSTGSYMSYKTYAESHILEAIKATGAIQTESNATYFLLNGDRNSCDKKVKAAVEKAMNEVEAWEDYDTTAFIIDEVTVVVERSNGGEKDIIFSRKFKTQKNHN